MFVYIFDRPNSRFHIKDYEWGYSKDMSYCGLVIPKLFNNSYGVNLVTDNICTKCIEVSKRYDNYIDDIRHRSNMELNLEFTLEFKENKYISDSRRYWPKLNKAKGRQAGNKFYEDKVHKSKNFSKYKKY